MAEILKQLSDAGVEVENPSEIIGYADLFTTTTFERPSELPTYDTLVQMAKFDRSSGSFDQVYGKNCGTRDEFRIVGGSHTTIDRHPWQVYFQGGITSSFKMKCGGSIISPNWVVTAAHCMNYGVKAKYSNIVHGLSTLPKDITKVSASNWKDAKQTIRHADYDGLMKVNDIALVETILPITVSQETYPICLPTNTYCLEPDTIVTVSGWGTVFSGGPVSSTLKHVDLPMISTPQCDRMHQWVDIDVTMICAGGKKGEDACQGDSGGPLIHVENNVATLTARVLITVLYRFI